MIEALGPFERRPRLAVAVSGGPDSLCLCLLAHGWAKARGGEVSALTVDHGLRPTSADEARQVAAWLGPRGIDHHVLRWTGAKPATAIQEAAREARYRLLGDWCRAAGVLHLLLAHHLDDQAETVAFRRARGSGPEGLAGMPAVRELAGLRLLRPLLGVPKARLVATLEAAGQAWLEDPSNV
ncbi:MAG TPA: tRNA lysidine(34) synthetase TilS, partial [Kofleriaceae bacterium]|nr:tRNA lysidine(34) synthetase TilS [Kofleriaceae bacterium]